VAAASWADDVVFTHNDSGDGARFFAVDTTSCATRASFAVGGATNSDWEDMARGTASDGTSVIWLADIGDNQRRRSSVVVYEVAEPGAAASGGTVRPRSTWTLTYPDGSHDAEALLVDPETGRPVVVTKDIAGGKSQAFRVPAGGSGELEPLARIDVRALDGGADGSLTAGDTSPDRSAVVLRSYGGAWVWTAAPGEPLAAVLARKPATVDVPLDRQPEAISFTRDGRGLWLTSEGVSAPIHHIPLTASGQPGDPAPATTAAVPSVVQEPAEAAAPVPAGRGRALLIGAAAMAVGVGVVALVLAMALRGRRRRAG
jgi:hypothetical protein